jgi:EmrB/QacA subfamily drug resistance transporter
MSQASTHLINRPSPQIVGSSTAVGELMHKDSRRVGWTLATLCVAQLMLSLDVLIVNIALPSAQRSLGFANSERQWVVTAYTLAFGSLLLLGGRLSDLFGRKRMFLIGLVGFGVASAVGGAATDFVTLVAARAVQGVFGAVLAPAALALLTTTFTEPKSRARAFGIYGALAAGGGALGLLLGGILVQYLNWRWCMFVNLGFVIPEIVGASTLLSSARATSRPKLDMTGIALVSSGLFGLVFGFSEASTRGWSSLLTWAPLAGGALFICSFVYSQTKVSSPALPLGVVLNRNRGASYLSIFMVGLGQFTMLLFVTYYLQRTLGYSAITCGLAFVPWLAAFVAVSQAWSRTVAGRVGPRWALGPGLALIGLALVMLSRISVHSGYAADVLPWLLVFGAGAGLTISTGVNAATAVSEPSHAGAASSLVNTSQMIGASVGTALFNSLSVSIVARYLTAHGAGSAAAAAAATHSYDVVFIVAAIVVLVGSALVGLTARGVGQRPAAAIQAQDDGVIDVLVADDF